ncbi:hypothetical protein QJS66_23530 (plasmid) [Kocuria rhizophila]|nr:hypothetical protein QJS66_23530 [Kocuria rhizophila]
MMTAGAFLASVGFLAVVGTAPLTVAHAIDDVGTTSPASGGPEEPLEAAGITAEPDEAMGAIMKQPDPLPPVGPRVRWAPTTRPQPERTPGPPSSTRPRPPPTTRPTWTFTRGQEGLQRTSTKSSARARTRAAPAVHEGPGLQTARWDSPR